MIRHTILFNLKPDVSKHDVERIFTHFLEMTSQINGILAMTGGTCYFHDQKPANQPFTHGLSIDFEDQRSRDAFLKYEATHPIKESITEIAAGGNQGMIGFDFGEWG